MKRPKNSSVELNDNIDSQRSINLERWTLVALAFLAVHAFVILAAYHKAPEIFGDVNLYEWWVRRGFNGGGWPVLDYDWIYPIGALIPMLIPALWTDTTTGYNAFWVLLLVLLNAVTVWQLVRRSWNFISVIYWLTFLFALGPIWLGRLDGVVAPLIILPLLTALSGGDHHPPVILRGDDGPSPVILRGDDGPSPVILREGRKPEVAGSLQPSSETGLEVVGGPTEWNANRQIGLATALATLGAWIKISPAAVVLVLAATARNWRELLKKIVLPGAVVSAALVALALLGGAGSRALSVFGEHGARGLQAESVAATWFSAQRLVDPGVEISFNEEIFTFEVQGELARSVATALDFLLPIAVICLTAYIWYVARRVYRLGTLDADIALRDPAIPVVSRRDFIAPHSRGPRRIVEDDAVGWEPTGPQDDGIISRRTLSNRLSPVQSAVGGRIAGVVLWGVLALVCALIVFNKVGSPQFFAWVGAAIAAGLALDDKPKVWLIPALLSLVGAIITQLIYPWQYMPFIFGHTWMILLAAGRNLIYVILLVWALLKIWRIGRNQPAIHIA